ncbi:polysaccharide export protein [Alsobacter sp. SYSU M60028]|uniref:Polysaccharide export protein n=1 Tax=Alsobacter ponti TaxID=2962936 RepID=A0ABT1LAB2_9HYPH|nr:polysaccharide biosynthesis/export family protein [Alsobacter ponti]MCP8938427.1 polysaccharide export protein [Alsobacter ponti]
MSTGQRGQRRPFEARGLRGLALALLAVLALACIPVRALAADYLLDSGDVLEISVFGMQEFKRRSTIDVDGNISMPLIGEVKASSHTLAEVRAKLKELLASNDAIRSSDVLVELVEHRPFYISGDVARAGAYPFRPSMTVRHAIALAGGYDNNRFKVENPLLMATDLRGQYEALWTDFAKRDARVRRLQAELDGKDSIDAGDLRGVPISAAVVEQIAKLENEALKLRTENQHREQAHLDRSVELADGQLAAIAAGAKNDDESLKIQMAEIGRVAELNQKGLAAANRLLDEQRTAMLLRSRQQENAARASAAELAKQDLARKSVRLAEDRRAALTEELQDALVEKAKVAAQLQSVGDKLLYSGALKAELSRTGQARSDITIFRTVDGQQATIPANEATPVMPGDVIEVLTKFDFLVATPRQ